MRHATPKTETFDVCFIQGALHRIPRVLCDWVATQKPVRAMHCVYLWSVTGELALHMWPIARIACVYKASRATTKRDRTSVVSGKKKSARDLCVFSLELNIFRLEDEKYNKT